MLINIICFVAGMISMFVIVAFIGTKERRKANKVFDKAFKIACQNAQSIINDETKKLEKLKRENEKAYQEAILINKLKYEEEMKKIDKETLEDLKGLIR